MRQISRVVPGVPFILTIPLIEIKNNPLNAPTHHVIDGRILCWAKQTFAQKNTTIKTCNHWEAVEFNDGHMQNVLRIEGCMYGGLRGKDVSDLEVERALKDFERFITTEESVILNTT